MNHRTFLLAIVLFSMLVTPLSAAAQTLNYKTATGQFQKNNDPNEYIIEMTAEQYKLFKDDFEAIERELPNEYRAVAKALTLSVKEYEDDSASFNKKIFQEVMELGHSDSI